MVHDAAWTVHVHISHVTDHVVWTYPMLQVFHESRVTVWSSVHSLAEGSMGGSRDGFHMSDIATTKVIIRR